MKLDKLELSALLGMQARHRELNFMMEQIHLQIQQLDEESKELFLDIEIRLQIEPDTLMNYDVDTSTGELIVKKEDTDPIQFGQMNESIESSKIATNGFKNNSIRQGITELEDVD